MSFIETIKERARVANKTIVLPEGMTSRTWVAADKILKENIAELIILATPEMVDEYSQRVDVSRARIIDPNTSPDLPKYIDEFVELRKAKGMTPEEAKRLLTSDFMYFACMMVKCGDADGVVSGACHSSANTLRPSLQILKTKPGAKLVSAFFLMIVPNCEYGADGTFVFSDCGLEQNPTPEKLAHIAIDSADTFRLLVQQEPLVALLSHSTKGSAKHPDVDKVVEAVKIAHEVAPDLKLDGELQTDAAIVPEVAMYKAPGSPVAGKANVLVFPDLDAGNVGYKLVQRLAKAEAYGPITQGLAGAVNDLSRGCNADDIVGVVAITAVQAQALDEEKRAITAKKVIF
ncbi:MAG: phosphate acetyltransferase [Lachnospiraceae bacterium]|nr:phosphate acetyltransferase [Lachnospiraceae bacterium]